MTLGPNSDRLPQYSPDGRQVGFLSDRQGSGDFQFHLLHLERGAARKIPAVDGWVEYFHWSPDGARVLLGVAGRGADLAGVQGATTSKQGPEEEMPWMPIIETGEEDFRWRHAWIYDLRSNRARPVEVPEVNVWEAVWCGEDALVAVTSDRPGEGHWYGARLHLMDMNGRRHHELYVPRHQVGVLAACPSGGCVAFVEAICSDRGLIAGDLRLLDPASGAVRRVDTRGVDVSYAEWRSDRCLLVAGHRGFETVIGAVDADSGTYLDTWSSTDLSTGGRYVSVAGLGESGDCALVAESFAHAPAIALVRKSTYRGVRSLSLRVDLGHDAPAAVERLTWESSDGTEVQGWLLKPSADVRPFATVMDIHGGPVWAWRPRWLGRSGLQTLLLLAHGYSVLLPNPRGSTGRGQHFVEQVLGDMGGADTFDYLSGLDMLVHTGVVDPKRIGVTGGSYGGFMTAWLVTQDSRFAAAVAVAPFTNMVSEQLVSNLPHFVSLFLNDTYTNPAGRYFQRSPIMHAHKARTPTLNICGSRDRATPPEEAVQFHNALQSAGVRSVLVTYPNEGHGIRQLPASIDYAARLVGWFVEHMPATSPHGASPALRA